MSRCAIMRMLDYTPLERLPVARPVVRLSFLASRCAGKRVLDLGGLDETAFAKQGTSDWLHGRIAAGVTTGAEVPHSPPIPPPDLISTPPTPTFHRHRCTIPLFLALP